MDSNLKFKKPGPTFYHILIFLVAQLAWFLLLGLWIYWYVSNYILLDRVDSDMASDIISGASNIATLVGGIILLILLSLSMSLIFLYLNRQMNITRLYDNFIANVTHELKSPLSSIQMYLETMQSREVPPPKSRQFFSIMLEDIARLDHLINSILYLSSFEHSKMARQIQHDYHVYDAQTIITEVIQETIHAYKVPRENVTMRGQLSAQCVVDRDWLKIVFSNLIDNAIKYSKAPLKLSVHLSQSDRLIYVEFRDNGVGIAPRDQKNIFNKFQRISPPNSPNVKGTGLGLYWVREIIKYHGGKINVKSDGLNRGTSFKIALPIYKTTKKLYIKRLLKRSQKQQSKTKANND
ncbi:MAG: sensor histidine kinase [Caldithrix sp.]|nr:sensor histidine kinase [Caldithrix sp.]